MSKDEISISLGEELDTLEALSQELYTLLEIAPRRLPHQFCDSANMATARVRLRLLRLNMDYLVLPLIKRLTQHKPGEYGV